MGGLADFLGDAGQVYGGYAGAEARTAQARRQKIEEELANMRLAEAKRGADYSQRLSAGLADFMPDGRQATTVTVPGQGAVIPATVVDDEGNAMPSDPGTGKKIKTENQLGALEYMKKAALQAGYPDKAMEIDKRIRAFKTEGLHETAQAILAGKSEDEIRDTFNRQGGVKLARVQRIQGTKGQITGVTEDGRPIQFDAENAMRSLLGPKDYIGAEGKEAALAAKEKDITARIDRGLKDIDLRGELGRFRAENDRIRADAAALRAEKYGQPKPADPAKARAERRKAIGEAARYAKDEATTNENGKTVIDIERANQIAGLANLMIDDDPDLIANPQAAAQAARAKLDELQAKAGTNAKLEWDEKAGAPRPRWGTFGMLMDNNPDPTEFEGMNRPDGTKEDKETFVRRRSAEIINNLLKGTKAGAKAQGGRPPPKPGDVVSGMTFLGGDPRDRNNWR